MASRQSHQLPTPPGGQLQYMQSYPQSQQQNYQQPPFQSYQPTPQQEQPPPPPMHSQQQRPRPKSRTLSFRSDKSAKSNGQQKVDMHETSAEKDAKRLHSKADPTMAINEAEPATVQANVKSSLARLRDMQHRDNYGNPISDPDRSNPTRSRWERPLDTIRGFEAAIDGGYNRKSMIRTDNESIANWNRRSSYYGNNTARFPQDSYYSNRATPFKPDSSQYDLRSGGPAARDSFYEPHGPGNAYGGAPPHPPAHGFNRFSRVASEPHLQNYGRPEQQSVYPIPNNHRSYETVASGSGSGISAEPAGYQTDPTSSDNSSIERMQSPPKRQPEPVNDYGIAFTPSAAYQPQTLSLGYGGANAGGPPPQQNPYQNAGGYGYSQPPAVPQKDRGLIAKRPTQTASNDQLRPGMPEKRKSWFTRRFSKQG